MTDEKYEQHIRSYAENNGYRGMEFELLNTIAALRTKLQPMDCGHLKAEWVEGAHMAHEGDTEHRCAADCQPGYCRRCAELEQAKMSSEHSAYAAVERHILGTERLIPEGHHTSMVIDRVLAQLQKNVVEACRKKVEGSRMTQCIIGALYGAGWNGAIVHISANLEALATDPSLRKGK
jgi:hypothetical protein